MATMIAPPTHATIPTPTPRTRLSPSQTIAIVAAIAGFAETMVLPRATPIRRIALKSKQSADGIVDDRGEEYQTPSAPGYLRQDGWIARSGYSQEEHGASQHGDNRPGDDRRAYEPQPGDGGASAECGGGAKREEDAREFRAHAYAAAGWRSGNAVEPRWVVVDDLVDDAGRDVVALPQYRVRLQLR